MANMKDPCINCPEEPDCYYPCKEAIRWTYKQEKENKNAKHK